MKRKLDLKMTRSKTNGRPDSKLKMPKCRERGRLNIHQFDG